MNKPSTVVIDPAANIHAIPARGTTQEMMAIKSVAARKKPPPAISILDYTTTGAGKLEIAAE